MFASEWSWVGGGDNGSLQLPFPMPQTLPAIIFLLRLPSSEAYYAKVSTFWATAPNPLWLPIKLEAIWQAHLFLSRTRNMTIISTAQTQIAPTALICE